MGDAHGLPMGGRHLRGSVGIADYIRVMRSSNAFEMQCRENGVVFVPITSTDASISCAKSTDKGDDGVVEQDVTGSVQATSTAGKVVRALTRVALVCAAFLLVASEFALFVDASPAGSDPAAAVAHCVIDGSR